MGIVAPVRSNSLSVRFRTSSRVNWYLFAAFTTRSCSVGSDFTSACIAWDFACIVGDFGKLDFCLWVQSGEESGGTRGANENILAVNSDAIVVSICDQLDIYQPD